MAVGRRARDSGVVRAGRGQRCDALRVATLAGVVAALAALGTFATDAPALSSAPPVRGQPICLPGTAPGDLDRLFVSEPGGVVGADYQRTTPLPDGRILWTFQDAEVRLPGGSTTLVHNVGMVQEGSCFSVLMGGTADAPRPWLFAESTTNFSRWYWPLGAEVGNDGLLYVFAAEMHERSPGYLVRTEPTSTAVAVVDTRNWNVVRTTAPANPGDRLYGWSIESDDTWTYLFAQCHRQFGYDLHIFHFAHDQSCANRVTVGRVPKGMLLAAPTYWTGRGWSADPSAAVPILDTADRMVNASQFVRVANVWMAITKVGDWWGDRIMIERAERAVGPYSVVASITTTPKCAVDCNTYFASWIPPSLPGQLVYGLSHNRWDGIATDVYRPTFAAIAAPPYATSTAQRCSLGHCG
jgi:hypothetical protein